MVPHLAFPKSEAAKPRRIPIDMGNQPAIRPTSKNPMRLMTSPPCWPQYRPRTLKVRRMTMMAPPRYKIENMGIPLVVATQAACHPNNEEAAVQTLTVTSGASSY